MWIFNAIANAVGKNFIGTPNYLFGLLFNRVKADGGVTEAQQCTIEELTDLQNDNLLSSASLIVTPNGYKEGKLYSVIPSDGSGDMSVTRATTATRVNSAGLVELVPYNLFSYSEQFENAYWVKSNTTVTANATTAPNGTLTADRIVSSAGSNSYLYRLLNWTIGDTYTLSFYVKADSPQTIRLYGFGNSVDLDVTTEWTRLSMTFTANLASKDAGIRGNSLNTNFDIYLWGAQLVQGTSARDYFATETRLNIPRLDYSLGSCPSLLVEPQRTNLALRSEEFDNATIWTNTIGGTGANPIRTANAVTSPSGIQNADTIVFDRGAGNTITDQSVISQQITIATTGTYYFSVWIKATASGDVGKQVFIRCGNAAALQAVTLTANWVRYETTATVTSGSNSFQVGNRGAITNANSVSVDLWGAQLEAGAYATSYIPTTSATVTRNADVVSKTGISSLIGQTEGTFVFKANVVQPIGLGVQSLLKASNDSESQLFIISYVANDGRVAFDFYIGSSYSFTLTSTSPILSGVNIIGVVYKAGAYKLYINGSQVASSTNSSPITNTISKLSIGSGVAPMYYDFLNLWKSALTDDQLELLTGTSFNTYAEMASYYNYTLQ
jgi:hypothetical protein